MSLSHAQDDAEDAMTRLEQDRLESSRSSGNARDVSQFHASRKRMNWDQVLAEQSDEPEAGGDHDVKRIKIESNDTQSDENDPFHEANQEIGERCIICLMTLRDRTLVGPCKHSGFCFECIGVWSNQSRKCPLCSTPMASYLLHDLDSSTPTKFFLPPLPEPRTLPSSSVASSSTSYLHLRPFRPTEDQRASKRPETSYSQAELDELEKQVKRRKEIYQYGLYVKHVASNPITHYRPILSPRQIAGDPELINRAILFLRRELRVWSVDDVEALTTYILSLLKSVDIRSELAIRLLAELFDRPDFDAATSGVARGAEHFAHELYSFLRSPFNDLKTYDDISQYDTVQSVIEARKARARSPSRSPSLKSEGSRGRSVSRSRSRSRSYSYSRSPSRSPAPARIQPPRIGGRRWDERDSWVDPEWLAKMEEKRRPKARQAQMQPRIWGDGRGVGDARSRPPPRANGEAAGVELLPDVGGSTTGLNRLTSNLPVPPPVSAPAPEPAPVPTLSIRGRAAASRQSLLDRLDQAKSQTSPSAAEPKSISVKPADQEEKLRLQAKLRAKLELAKASKIMPDAKAQELKEKLLARKRASLAGDPPVSSNNGAS